MISTITITPTSNIYNHRILDDKNIEKRTYDSELAMFEFFNSVTNERRTGNLMSVSLYDDVIIEGDVHYKILHMLSTTKSTKPCEC